MTTPRPTKGYAIKSYREIPSRCGFAFHATLTLNGKKIGEVSNDGNGGGDFYQFTNRADQDAFDAFAKEWNAGTELAGYGDSDQFVSHLILGDELNRKKLIPFHTTQHHYAETGQYSQFQGVSDLPTLVKILSGPKWADQDPHIWVREMGDFVPLEHINL